MQICTLPVEVRFIKLHKFNVNVKKKRLFENLFKLTLFLILCILL